MTDKAEMFPVLRYEDAPKVVDWLETTLGFKTGMNMPAEDGGIAHAEVRLGGAHIMLGSLRPLTAEDPWGSERHVTYVYVDDVDAHYERAKAAGAEIVMDLRDMEYGSREYGVRDPEGSLWSFGSYRPSQG